MKRLFPALLIWLAIGATAHAQVNPVYRQNPVTGDATQQQQITVPSGFAITLQSGSTLACQAGASCTGGTAGSIAEGAGYTGGTAFGLIWDSANTLKSGPITTTTNGDLSLPGTNPVISSAAANHLYLGGGGNSTSATANVEADPNGVNFNAKSTGIFGFSSTTNAGGAVDTGLSRSAAGVVAIGNGSSGDASGTVKANSLTLGSTCTLTGIALATAWCTVSGGVINCPSLVGFTSITRASSGSFVATLSSAAANTNYKVVGMAAFTSGTANAIFEDLTTARTTTVFHLVTPGATGDPAGFSLTVYP